MKGIFVVNKYYSDDGMDFVFNSLFNEFKSLKIELVKHSLTFLDNGLTTQFGFNIDINSFDFAIFWDKNTYLAYQLEKCGIKVFNSADSISICDDKIKTYQKLKGVSFPKTIIPFKMYDNCKTPDYEFLDYVQDELKFPIIVKENTGSQGRQVFLAKDRTQLNQIYGSLCNTNHHYQQFLGEFGVDVRFYVVGSEVCACYKRKGTSFKSNLFDNGTPISFSPSLQMKQDAISIINQLGLDFGTSDFLACNDRLLFLEANSSAYFLGASKLGFNVAKKIANHIKNTMEEGVGN